MTEINVSTKKGIKYFGTENERVKLVERNLFLII